MDNQGWIKLFRKFKDWEWYKDINTKTLFIEILLSANFEDKKWQGIQIHRGEYITSIEKICEEIGLTRQQVRYSLNKLKVTNEVTIQTNKHYTLIKVNKYNDYQEVTNQVTINEPSSNHPVTITKEYKNDKNDKNNILSVNTPYSNIEDLTEQDFQDIANKYKAPIDFVKFQYDKMVTWKGSNPKNPKLKGRNWRMTLMAWVRDDKLKIYTKQNERTSKIAVVTTDGL